MRACTIVSTAIALISLHVHGAPHRRLEAMTEGQTLSEIESFFGVELERKFKDLPTSGTIKPEPWNGPKWELYFDSINNQWKSDQPSPTEKYAMAFGLNATELKDKVSAKLGFFSVDSSSVQCTTSCRKQEDVCTFRGDVGVCIPRWESLSDGLALASIFEKEPYCSIHYKGVHFEANDIKGLISAVYAAANLPTIMVGLRKNDDAVSIDEYGRPREASYRDVNPGFFHITVANVMGELKHPLIIDQYPGCGAWDQALSGFKVYEHDSMTPNEAAEKFYKADAYPFNDKATEIIYVRSRVFWNNAPFPVDQSRPMPQNEDSNASYTYLLELNEAREIIGGEWLNVSTKYHPNYIVVPTEKPAVDLVTNVGFSYANVVKLVEISHACPAYVHPAN